ncbi:molybdopterin synthase sulfur carrier subunit [Xylariaceae sp. FL0594]|nr:molybdopterin synthase sulfur carrier subunit [Xylariaceae sp. FL0594]
MLSPIERRKKKRERKQKQKNMSTVPKAPKGHFTLLYFASASSFTGLDHEPLPAPLPVDRLFDVLEDRHPGIRDKILSSCLVTVNLDYVDLSSSSSSSENILVIQEGDEVAIIPPVSSG